MPAVATVRSEIRLDRKALDKATGKTVWEIELEAGANGAPMTYLFNGKQYIVFAIGGQSHPAELVALSLP